MKCIFGGEFVLNGKRIAVPIIIAREKRCLLGGALRRPTTGLLRSQSEGIQFDARSEVMVACVVPRMDNKEECMLEPITLDNTLVSTPYAFVEGSRDVRIENQIGKHGK